MLCFSPSASLRSESDVNSEISAVKVLSARQPGDVYPRSTPHPLALNTFFSFFTTIFAACVALAVMYFLYFLCDIFSSSCVLSVLTFGATDSESSSVARETILYGLARTSQGGASSLHSTK